MNDRSTFSEGRNSCQLQPTISVTSIASHDFDRYIPSSTPLQPSSPVPFEQQDEMIGNYDHAIQQNTADKSTTSEEAGSSVSQIRDEAKSSLSLFNTSSLEPGMIDDPNILDFFTTQAIVESTNPFSDPQMPPLVRVEFESLFEPCELRDDEHSNSNNNLKNPQISPHFAPSTSELETGVEPMTNFNQIFDSLFNDIPDQDKSSIYTYQMLNGSNGEDLDEHDDEFEDSTADITQFDVYAYSVLKEEDDEVTSTADETLKNIYELSEYQESNNESDCEENFTARNADRAKEIDSSSSDDESEWCDRNARPLYIDDESDNNEELNENDEIQEMSPSEFISSMAIDDDFFLLEFPEVVRDPNVKVMAQPKLEGDIKVYLSEIYSPVHFWFQCEENLLKLEINLEKDYEGLTQRQLGISANNIKPGLLVACYLRSYKKWHRASVVNAVNHEGSGSI